MPKALIPLADGVEEMEAVIIMDTLRRAKWEVVSVAMTGAVVVCSRGVKIMPDTGWDDVKPDTFDALVLPGGRDGVRHLSGDSRILAALRRFNDKKRWIGAICAAPLVLQAAGILEGRTVTSHPAVRSELMVPKLSNDRVVVDGHLITSQGPGTSFEFALALIHHIENPKAADAVRAGLVL